MNRKTRTLIFIAMYVALAVVLDYVSELIPFLQMPQGGNINLALISVFMASYHLGWKNGIITGLLWWLVGFMMGQNRWYLTPIQYILDYIGPAIVCGFAAAFPKVSKVSNVFTGVTVTMVLKYFIHTLAGVYFWFPETTYAGSAASWIYSLGYNLWYNLATLIICVILVPILVKALNRGSNKFVGYKG